MSTVPPPERQTLGVLLVEDDAIVRTWIGQALRTTEFFVAAEVEEGAAAAAALSEANPAVMVVDYLLPDHDGVEVVRALREDGVRVPALLLTASARPGLNEAAVVAGFQGTLVKAGQVEPLLAALRLVAAGEPAFDERNPAADLEAGALSRREREVLVPHDGSARAVAAELGFRERGEVYAVFAKSAQTELAALHEELARLETVAAESPVAGDRLAFHAHTLRSGAVTVGAAELGALAGEIEAEVRDKPRLAGDELRRVNVLVRELGVRVARLHAVDVAPGYVTPPREDGSGPPPKSVLVVDDDPAVLKLFEVVLRREANLRVERATSGRQALGIAVRSRPDLIVLDILLPDMDGADFLRRLRTHAVLGEIPVIVASVEAAARGEELKEAGADVVLSKPVDTGRFLDLVRIGLGRED